MFSGFGAVTLQFIPEQDKKAFDTQPVRQRSSA
jgi:hypothetical protein